MKKIVLFLMLIMSSVLVFAMPTDGVNVEENLPLYYEPSGIVWHPNYNLLFVVSDEGVLSQMDVSGSSVESWTIGGDLEGITYAGNDYVYVLTEYPMAIREFDPRSGTVTKTWSLDGVVPSPASSNSALEGIAFVPNGFHPYADSDFGGLFYLGMQENGYIYVVDIKNDNPVLVDSFSPVSRSDISDLFFNKETNTLYILYDGADLIREIRPDKTFLAEYSVSGYDQEGITMLPSCPSSESIIFIAEDSGRVMKYENFEVDCSVIEEEIIINPNEIVEYNIQGDSVLVEYADGMELTFNPFYKVTSMSSGLNGNNDRLIVSNGKFVKVFKKDVLVAQKQIGLRVVGSTMSVVDSGSYDQITISYPFKKKTLTVTLKLIEDQLEVVSLKLN